MSIEIALEAQRSHGPITSKLNQTSEASDSVVLGSKVNRSLVVIYSVD